MNSKALVFAVAAACLTSGAAFAQSYDYRSDRNDGDQRSTQYQRSDRYDRNDHARRDERRDYRRHDGYARHDRNDRYDGHRDYRQQRHQMRRGERMSQHYRGDYAVVSDWRSRRLYAPQRGYHWVQAGNDYALVAIATGIIASVLLNH